MTINQAIRILQHGGVGVIPTDTIYGVVGSALDMKAVERIYRLRDRNRRKPMIILISSALDVRMFGVKLNPEIKKLLGRLWPGRVSVILKCISKRFAYLHRGTKTLAFRLPAKKFLRAFLKKTGPLVAPSANLEGKPPAQTIIEAWHYFGDRVDFYIDGGRLDRKPSKLVAMYEGKDQVLRH